MFRKIFSKSVPMFQKGGCPYLQNYQIHQSSKVGNKNIVISASINSRSFRDYSTSVSKNIEPPVLEQQFLSVFPEVVKDLTENDPENSYNKDMGSINAWFARVLEYNVPFGKRSRGLATAWAYRYSALAPDEEGVKLSYILGWCLEMMQAYILLVDDMMDNSEMRRGRPSWHRVDGIGSLATNDACFLYSAIFVLLKKYFENKPYYVPLIELLHDVNHKTIYGQCLDSRTPLSRDYEGYDMDLYWTILRYKAGYYVTYLPVKAGMLVAGMPPQIVANESLKSLMFEIGELYQFQNDYYDCFGEAGVMGKPGNDIQEGKCTWNFVTAKKKATPSQKSLLMENYGHNDPYKAKIVKDIYEQVQIPKEYDIFMEATYKSICSQIEKLPKEIPRELFKDVIKAAQIKQYKLSSN